MSTALTVLVVDDQASVRASIALTLDRMGHRFIEADAGEWALDLFKRHRPDVVLLDVEMPGHDGYWVSRQIREAEAGGWTPIIYLSSASTDHDVSRGIEAGGDDYLIKPASPVVLQAKLRAMQRLRNMRERLIDVSEELRRANERLQTLTELDALTGLINRRGFDLALAREMFAARRDGRPLSLLLCDVDHFKAYNDNLGHVAGDRCLQDVARLLRQSCMRPRDVAARYGGEEFALLMPDTPKTGAMTFARGLVRMLAQHAPPHPCSPISDKLSISGGITTCIPDGSTTPEDLLMRADEALYAAKENGRNRFFSFEMQLDSIAPR